MWTQEDIELVIRSQKQAERALRSVRRELAALQASRRAAGWKGGPAPSGSFAAFERRVLEIQAGARGNA